MPGGRGRPGSAAPPGTGAADIGVHPASEHLERDACRYWSSRARRGKRRPCRRGRLTRRARRRRMRTVPAGSAPSCGSSSTRRRRPAARELGGAGSPGRRARGRLRYAASSECTSARNESFPAHTAATKAERSVSSTVERGVGDVADLAKAFGCEVAPGAAREAFVEPGQQDVVLGVLRVGGHQGLGGGHRATMVCSRAFLISPVATRRLFQARAAIGTVGQRLLVGRVGAGTGFVDGRRAQVGVERLPRPARGGEGIAERGRHLRDVRLRPGVLRVHARERFRSPPSAVRSSSIDGIRLAEGQEHAGRSRNGSSRRPGSPARCPGSRQAPPGRSPGCDGRSPGRHPGRRPGPARPRPSVGSCRGCVGRGLRGRSRPAPPPPPPPSDSGRALLRDAPRGRARRRHGSVPPRDPVPAAGRRTAGRQPGQDVQGLLVAGQRFRGAADDVLRRSDAQVRRGEIPPALGVLWAQGGQVFPDVQRLRIARDAPPESPRFGKYGVPGRRRPS